MKKRLAFIVNTAAFFVSHRLPIAIAASRRGFAVDLYTGAPVSPHLEHAAIEDLAKHSINHRAVQFTSAGLNPLAEAIGVWQLIALLRQSRPDIVHCVTPKGVLYGGIAARFARVPAFVAAVSGQGYAFTEGESSINRTLARVVYSTFSRFALAHKNKRIIVQNPEDQRAILESGLARECETVFIDGSGIDLSRYVSCSLEDKQPIVLLPARMLRDKGVLEFAEAARILKSRRTNWRFVLAGGADHKNPSRIDPAMLRQWNQDGIVEWLGHVEDMPRLFAAASIVCLPSYREGLPKSLLEAAASGCAVVTTDVPGCRDAIKPGATGDLVPAHAALALANAIEALIVDPLRRERYGRAGREMAQHRFGIEAVIERTLATYDVLYGHIAVN